MTREDFCKRWDERNVGAKLGGFDAFKPEDRIRVARDLVRIFETEACERIQAMQAALREDTRV